MSKFNNYNSYVYEQAEEFVDEYADQMVASVIDNGDSITDEIDTYTSEWVDNEFIYTDIIDHATIIRNSSSPEDDSGLWEGQDPERAIETMAYFTYRRDLQADIRDVIQERLDEKYEEYERERDSKQEEVDALNEQIEALQEEDESDENIEEIDIKEDEVLDLERDIERLDERLENLQDAIEEL